MNEAQTASDIRHWFASHADEYANETEAAEACSNALGRDEWLDDECHILWEIALDYFPA